MSPAERPLPPVGEEIHIPGPSLDPLLLTVGITMALLGLTVNTLLLIAGGILTVAVLIHWIIDARKEFYELPVDHHAGHAPDAH